MAMEHEIMTRSVPMDGLGHERLTTFSDIEVGFAPAGPMSAPLSPEWPGGSSLRWWAKSLLKASGDRGVARPLFRLATPPSQDETADYAD